MSNSVQPHRQQPTRLLHLWDSLGKNTGVGCHFLLHIIRLSYNFLGKCSYLSLVSQLVKNLPAMKDPSSIPRSEGSPGEGINYPLQYSWTSLVVQVVKNPLAMQETWVQSLGWEDPLEEGMATHSSFLACLIPMDRGAWWLQSMGSQRVGHD